MKSLLWLITLSILGFVFSTSATEVPIVYETCTTENNYLEEALPNLPYERATEDRQPFPKACIWRSHINLPVRGFYGFCPTDQGPISRSHPRPCVSEKYVSAVYESLSDVTDCFGYDIRFAYASFNLESSMHPNAVGGAGDAGIGQLTASAIEQVSRNALKRTKDAIRFSQRPSCRRILAYMEPFSSAPADRCGFMNLPDNPNRNLIYSVLLLQQNRKLIERYFRTRDIRIPPTVNVSRLQLMLSKLGYNAGMVGLAASLKVYTEIMENRLAEHHFHFENTDKTSFVNFLSQHFPVREGQEATRKRVSKYMGFVIASVRRVDRQLGSKELCYASDLFPPLGVRPFEELPTVDDTEIDQRIAKELLLWADDFKARVGSLNQKTLRDCEQIRQDFRAEFLGNGQSIDDAHPVIQKQYQSLCN